MIQPYPLILNKYPDREVLPENGLPENSEGCTVDKFNPLLDYL